MSAPAKPWELDAQERICSFRPCLWAPSMVERDIILEALTEFPDPSETNARSLAWAGSSRIPAVANAAS